MRTADMYAADPGIASIRNVGQILAVPDRYRLLDRLVEVFERYYVHLPQKRAAFAADPVRLLTVLRDDAMTMGSDHRFMRAVLGITNTVRDRHTTLTLPAPWSGMVAYLPYLVEQCHVCGEPRYIVSKKLPGRATDAVEVGSLVTHWNGVPVHSYLTDVLGPQSQGSNQGAAVSLALSRLTVRPLAHGPLPDEDWVTLSCLTPSGAQRNVALPWKWYFRPDAGRQSGAGGGMSGGMSGGVPDCMSSGAAGCLNAGMDLILRHVRSNLVYLYGRRRPAGSLLRSLGDILDYGTVLTTSGPVGYLRIFTFDVGDLSEFVRALIRILRSLPQDRLIVDIRGNPGGLITAGESLVQLLCRWWITPSPVTFRGTAATRRLAALPEFARWKPSLDAVNVSGQEFGQLFPLTAPWKLPPYRYPGRSLLVTDGLSYSTCDFVAAGFKDNRVGPVVGVERRTGGGGANVWAYDTLARYARMAGGPPLEPLPAGMSMGVSMRRSVRTGLAAGMPVENFGVEADRVLHLSPRDLMDGNVDLLNQAAAILSGR